MHIAAIVMLVYLPPSHGINLLCDKQKSQEVYGNSWYPACQSSLWQPFCAYFLSDFLSDSNALHTTLRQAEVTVQYSKCSLQAVMFLVNFSLVVGSSVFCLANTLKPLLTALYMLSC